MAEGRIKNTELSAIAAAIRSKNGSSTVYKPAEMAAAILDIPAGGSAVIESKSITANGTYTAPTGVDGYNPVVVNVSGAVLDPDHMYYNGTLLPTIPTVSGKPYVFIRRNTNTGFYDAMYSSAPWEYYSGESNDGITSTDTSQHQYRCSIQNPEKWELYGNFSIWWGIDANRPFIWINVNIGISPDVGFINASDPVPHYIT